MKKKGGMNMMPGKMMKDSEMMMGSGAAKPKPRPKAKAKMKGK